MNSYKVTKRLQIPNSAHEFLEGDNYSDKKLLSGLIHNTQKFWLASGPNLCVFNTKTGAKISRWTFGSSVRDLSVKIVCIKELKSSHKESSLLAVGLEYNIEFGMVCIFDLSSWKVLRAIQFLNKVTSLHVISSGDGSSLFPGPLNNFDGAIAVGTSEGDVYIVDLCKEAIDDAKNLRDEVNPCEIHVININKIDQIEALKQISERNQEHLALHLNALLSESSPHFVLKGPQGDDRVLVNKSEVCISALEYAPQLSSLLVGYNFGALQIWNIVDMSLAYTSPVYEENVPISYFAIQEPVDDPRAFCYFWAVYSHTEQVPKSFPIAALYSLRFDYKDWHEGYGFIYKNLQSCAISFQVDLNKIDSDSAAEEPISAQCIRLESLTKCSSKDAGSTSFLDSHEDNFTMCLMVWNVQFKDHTSNTYLSLFDLNQWYKEQMPSRIRIDQCIKYMANICLSDVVYNDRHPRLPILDAHINTNTIVPFMAVQKLEEIFYPTSLSFECITISEQEISILQNCGYQKQFLNDLQNGGPLILIKPNELYERSLKLGFSPICMDNAPNINSRVSLQEHILNIALEYKMKNWLHKCAFSWSNGSHRSAGLSLDFLLDWAWRRIKSLKSCCNKICALLFDCQQEKLDENTKVLFSQCRSQILILKDLYCYICNNCSQFLINEGITRKQCMCIKQIFAYLDVLSWMINIGLLPECTSIKHINDENRLVIPYLADEIINYYTERRKHLNDLNKSKKLFEDDAILYIDKVIKIAGESFIKNEWTCDGDSGIYPPSSLQTILRTYLLDNVDIFYKHVILSYFLLDIAMSLPKEKFQSILPTLIKFPTIFNLSTTDVKIIQGLWQLDHGNFGTAVEQIIDPSIKSVDLPCWFHPFILKVLMLNDQKKLALIYLKIRNPPLNSISDVSMGISLYVSNNMVSKALQMQRQYSSPDDNTLLKVLYDECVKEKQLQELMNLNLTKQEEKSILDFMDINNFPHKNHCKFIYFFQRNRFLHLYDMFSSNKASIKHELGSLGGFMDMVKVGLPLATQNTLNICVSERNNFVKNEPHPKPLSVFYHNKEEKLKYKSDFLYACIKKAKEAWGGNKVEENNFLSDDDFPFLRSHYKLEEKSPKNKLIYPKIVRKLPKMLEDDGPSPPKKMKLSPEKDLNEDSLVNSPSTIHLTKIVTPVVKRKSYRKNDSFANVSDIDVLTPHSILKVRNNDEDTLMHISPETPHQTSNLSNNIFNKRSFSNSYYESTPCDKQVPGVSRKSLSRTSVVRFKDYQSTSPSVSSLQNSPTTNIDELSSIKSNDSNKQQSKIDSISTDNDSFITPEASINADLNQSNLKEIQANVSNLQTEENDEKTINRTRTSIMNTSVEPRKSYREDKTSPTSIKSSTNKTSLNDTQKSELNSPMPTRISSRRSLTRQVLENNAFSKMLSSTDLNTSSKISTTETSFTKKETNKIVGENILEQSTEIYSAFDKVIKENKSDGEENIKESHNEIITCVKTKIAESSEIGESDEMEVDVYADLDVEENPEINVIESKINEEDITNSNKSVANVENNEKDQNSDLHDPKMNNFFMGEDLVQSNVGPSENEIEYVKELASPHYTYHEKQDAENSNSVKHIYPEIEVLDRNTVLENETRINDESKNSLDNAVILSDIDISPENSDGSGSSQSNDLNKAGFDIISINSGTDENTRDTEMSGNYIIEFHDDEFDNNSSDNDANRGFYVSEVVLKDSQDEKVIETYSVDSSDSNEQEIVLEKKEDDNKSDNRTDKDENVKCIENPTEINVKLVANKSDEEDNVKESHNEVCETIAKVEESSEIDVDVYADLDIEENTDNKESKEDLVDINKPDEKSEGDNTKNDFDKKEELVENKKNPSTPSKPKGRRRKSLSVKSEIIESPKVQTTPVRVTRRSLRSASVDTPTNLLTPERILRRRSTSGTTEMKPEANKRRSVVFPKSKSANLAEDIKKTTPRRSLNVPQDSEEKPLSLIEEYSFSRRLTRNQKMLLEKSMSTISINEENLDESAKIQLEQLNPLVLLTKEDYVGPKDPDESDFLEKHSVSSVISDSNTSVSKSSKKVTSRRKSDSVEEKPRATRSRKNSEEIEESEVSRRTTRSRSRSLSESSDNNVSIPSRGRGRPPKVSKKVTELEKIAEESPEDLEKSTTRKRRRAL